MKKTVLCALMVLALCACNKTIDAIVEKKIADATAPAAGAAGFVKYTIQSGNQYADGNTYKAINLQEQKFIARFDSSAIYQTKDPANQYDINKLYGFSDNNALHHDYSARFGWRWSDGALRLFAYVYNAGVVSSKELKAVAMGKDITCGITVTSTSYIFSVDGLTDTMPRASTTASAIGYQLYPYFGGDETAPHAVSIWIKPL